MAGQDGIGKWRGLLKLAGVVGATLFFAALVVTWVAEDKLKAAAHAYMVQEIAQEVEGRLLSGGGVLAAAASTFGRLVDSEAGATEEKLREVVPPLVGTWLSDYCNCSLSPQDSTALEELATDTAIKWSQPWIERLKKRADELRDFAEGRYDERWAGLITELRIFFFSNGALFLFSFLILRFRPARSEVVLFPLTLLALATCASIYVWVGGQNWFWTILTNNYLGWSYLIIVGILFLVLAYASLGGPSFAD